VALAGTARAARAQWSPDPQVNNPVVVAADLQALPVAVSDIFGVVVAWRSARFDVGSGTTVYDIYAQRIGANGLPQWGSNGVLVALGTASPMGSQDLRPLAMAKGGGVNIGEVILAWHDVRDFPDPGNIYAQKLNGSGIPQWQPGGIAVTSAFGLQDGPRVLSDGADGAIFVWQDRRAGPANSDIYAQRLSASGLPQWPPTDVAVCSAPADQVRPSMASAVSNGVYLIAWTDSRGGAPDIYAQYLNVFGGPQWALNGVPVSTAPGVQERPVINESGFIAWEDGRNGDPDIYAQQVAFTGVPQWTANGVQVASTPNASRPVIFSNFGSLFIAWQDERNGPANTDIFAQNLNNSGVPLWPVNGVTVSGAAGNQTSPVVTGQGTSYLVSWEDARNGPTDIFAQRISLSGVAQWTANGVPFTTAANGQRNVAVVPSLILPGGVIAVWEDDRSAVTTTDIYASQIDMTGALPVSLHGFAVE
jgi:hypothetical protein